MRFNRGLIRDRKPIDLPSGAWSNARNVIMTKASTLSNEEGIEEFGNHPPQLSPIGKLLLNQKLIIFSQDNTFPEFSEIGYLDKSGEYFTIIRSIYLGFTKEFPILKAEGQINYVGDEVISWITLNDSPKVLNITTLPFELDVNKELVDPLKINALRIFQEYDNARIEIVSVNETGGSIPSGTVQFALAYSNKGLSRTSILNPTNPVPITPSNLSSFDKVQGAEASTNTSKSVSIRITEADTRFDFIHLFAIKRNAGTISVEEVIKLPINTTVDYTYTGAESSTDVTLEELLVDRVNYNIAKAMTQVNDRLYLGNLTAKIAEDFHLHFLNLQVNYTTQTLSYGGLPPNGIKAPKVIHSLSGFFPGEVYALYATARLKDGTVTPAYHIPGREVAEIPGYEGLLLENATISIDGTYSSVGGGNIVGPVNGTEDYNSGARKWFQTRPTANNANATTNMGYWENDTEVYPEGFGTLTGEKVRHHRFPESYEINASLTSQALNLKTIGIVISGFDLFPQEVLDQIDSIEVFYGKKDLSNSLIIGQDISRFENKELAAAEPFNQYFGGNWDLRYEDRNNDTNGDWSTNGANVQSICQLDRTRMRFNNFDLMNSKAGVTPNYVTFQYRFRSPLLASTYNEGVRTGFLVESSADRGNISDPNQRKTRLFGVLDYTGFDVTSLGPVTGIQYLKQVSTSKYVPANITIGTEINKLGNEHFLVQFPNTTNVPSITAPRMEVNYDDGRIRFTAAATDREEVYVYNLCQVRTDLFKSFTNQQLVSCGVFIKEFTVPFTVYGGDALVSECSYMDHCMVPTIRRDPNNNSYYITDEYYRGEDAVYEGVKIARRFMGYFRGNAGYRHLNEGIGNSQFHSAADINSLFEDYRRDQAEVILYNEDYSFKNELISVYPYNPEKKEAEKFPTRILRSPLQGRETTEIQWNGFLPGDYYEHQKNRGEIINLEADNDRLFIHCRHGLFITRSSDTLSGNEADITISSGDIFALPPREILTSDAGYAGLHSSFATKKCKLGYIFADVDQGKVFIVNEGIDEISSYGLRNEFIQTLPIAFNSQNGMEVDQPYQQIGILIEFDERFNRVLLVKKDLELVNPELLDDSETPTLNKYYFRNGKLVKYNGAVYVDLTPEEYIDRGFTISYYPGSPGLWLAFHDYSPDMFLNNRFGLLSYKGDVLYRHNSPLREFYGQPFRSFVDFVFAEPNTLTKSLASISWQSEVINGSLSEQRSTFTSAIVYNSYQCSGEVVFTDRNITYVENEWRFNNFMDVVIDRNEPFMENFEVITDNINQNMLYYKQRKMIDKYFVVRLYYNNSLSKDIYIYDVTAKARPSAQ